jgi:hypothetical protein
MFQLKALNAQAIPRALDRAERYRLLNEPWEAESICRDILATEPDNQAAVVALLLALTDQFGGEHTSAEARAHLPRIRDEYQRAYYAGVISERWAKAGLRDRAPGHVVHDWFVDALRHYDVAAALSPAGNEDAVLRWNACVRQLHKYHHLRPHLDEPIEHEFSDCAPPR